MPPRVNPYVMAHKVARHLLYDAAQRLGRADLESDDECQAALDVFLSGLFFLRFHAKFEEEAFHPALRERAPDVEKALTADHHELHPVLELLEHRVEAFGKATGADRHEAAARLLDSWNDFTAKYTTHLRHEETIGTDAWHEHFSDEEMLGLTAKGQASIPPEVMQQVLPLMLPVISPEEAAAIYNGMRAGAPPPAVEGFEKAAARILGKRWKTVQARAERMRG